MNEQQSRGPAPARLVRRGARRRGRAGPALVALVLVVAAVATLVMHARGSGGGPAQPAANATVAALTTVVAGQRQQLAARQTVIARQQAQIAQLQRTATARSAPSYSSDGPHSYIATFQLEQYSYVLFLQWNETGGFVRDGRLLTADNYSSKSTRTFQISGVDNNRSYGFVGSNGTTMTFTGIESTGGTFTVTGVPWSVFRGFVGGSFSQTLHPGTLAQFQADVGRLVAAPS